LAPGSEVIQGFGLLWLPCLLVTDSSSSILNIANVDPAKYAPKDSSRFSLQAGVQCNVSAGVKKKAILFIGFKFI